MQAPVLWDFSAGHYPTSASPSHGLTSTPTNRNLTRSERWISIALKKVTPVGSDMIVRQARVNRRKLTHDHQPPCCTIINRDAETCIVAPLAYLERRQLRVGGRRASRGWFLFTFLLERCDVKWFLFRWCTLNVAQRHWNNGRTRSTPKVDFPGNSGDWRVSATTLCSSKLSSLFKSAFIFLPMRKRLARRGFVQMVCQGSPPS
jgi:hypothetical protein